VLQCGVPLVRIYHNSLWARYKGVIFADLFALHRSFKISVNFVHVAETSDNRGVLGPPDRTYHAYPYELLFHESSDHIPPYKLAIALVRDIIRTPSQLVVIPGYHRFEYWAMLFVCMVLGRKRAVFCDSTANDNPRNRLKDIAKRFFFRHCDGFFCYGSRSEEYIRSYGIDPALIHHPCQAAALPHDYNSNAIRRHYEAHSEFSAESPSFLFVGRLSKEKGLQDLLQAFSGVYERLPMARLVIAGSGELLNELRLKMAELKLDAAVSFIGVQSPQQIGDLLLKSTALVLPSHSEPWGLVVNEALSYGCPVVVSDICGCAPELVRDGLTGYTFAAGKIDALSDAMLKAVILSKQRLQTAKRCLDSIAQYTPERAACEILKGCVQILQNGERR
jgi:glycosyltransferase involved in cell wall biosynthesis